MDLQETSRFGAFGPLKDHLGHGFKDLSPNARHAGRCDLHAAVEVGPFRPREEHINQSHLDAPSPTHLSNPCCHGHGARTALRARAATGVARAAQPGPGLPAAAARVLVGRALRRLHGGHRPWLRTCMAVGRCQVATELVFDCGASKAKLFSWICIARGGLQLLLRLAAILAGLPAGTAHRLPHAGRLLRHLRRRLAALQRAGPQAQPSAAAHALCRWAPARPWASELRERPPGGEGLPAARACGSPQGAPAAGDSGEERPFKGLWKTLLSQVAPGDAPHLLALHSAAETGGEPEVKGP